MSTKTTLVLLALLILVGGVVYFTQVRKPGGEAATPVPPESTSLLDVSTPAIDGITVRDVVSNTQVSATRDVSGTWWLTEPAGQTGDPAALNSIAQRLAYIYVQRVLTPTGSLSEFGLVTPTLTVEVATASGLQSFVVGDTTPSKGAYYAQKPGDPRVYLIDTGLVGDLKQLAEKPPVALPPPATLVPMTVETPVTVTTPVTP